MPRVVRRAGGGEVVIPPTSVADTRGEMLHFEDGSWMTVWPSDRRGRMDWYREACGDAVRRNFIPDPANPGVLGTGHLVDGTEQPVVGGP